MYAIGIGNEDIVKLLIENGANINIQNTLGTTPLILGVKKCNKAIVKLLIEKGAKVDKLDNNGNTALDYVKNIRITYYDKYDDEDVLHESETEETKEKITDLLNNPLQFDIGLSSNDFNI